jgi:hypothetical protein
MAEPLSGAVMLFTRGPFQYTRGPFQKRARGLDSLQA